MLTANKGGAATLVVRNTSVAGVGLRAENAGGYGLWGVGLEAGVRGIGTNAGIIGEANPSSGIGVIGRRGFRSGRTPSNTGNVNATVRGLTIHTATAPISHVPMQMPHNRVPTGWRKRSSS